MAKRDVGPPLKALLFLACSALAVLVYLFLLNVLRGKLGAFGTTAAAFVLAAAALIVNWRFFRSEGRSLAEIGFSAPALRIAQGLGGFAGGALIVGTWMLMFRIVASATWRALPAVDAAAVLGALTFTVFNNAGEELVYRGYLFVLLMRSYNPAVAVIATSILFALLHYQAGIPLLNVIAGVFTSALLYAALFVRWRSVPLVLGVHAGMNFMQELAGLRRSGLTIAVPEFAHPLTSSEGMTILAVIAVVNLVAAAVVIFRRTHLASPPAGETQ